MRPALCLPAVRAGAFDSWTRNGSQNHQWRRHQGILGSAGSAPNSRQQDASACNRLGRTAKAAGIRKRAGISGDRGTENLLLGNVPLSPLAKSFQGEVARCRQQAGERGERRLFDAEFGVVRDSLATPACRQVFHIICQANLLAALPCADALPLAACSGSARRRTRRQSSMCRRVTADGTTAAQGAERWNRVNPVKSARGSAAKPRRQARRKPTCNAARRNWVCDARVPRVYWAQP